MTNSKGSSVVIGNEGAQDGLLAVVVVPDGSSEGEQSLQYPGHDTLGSVSPVSFQVELAFQGLIDRLDQLTEWLQESCPGSRGLALLRRTDELRTPGGQESLELGTGIALVGQDDLTRSIGEQILVDLEQVSGHFSLVDLGIGQCEGHRKPGRGADQMQSQSPEVTGVTGAVAIAGEAGEVTASDRRTGTSTLDRGRVDHPGVVVPEVSILTEDPDQGVELGLGLPQPFVVAGLVGQIGEVPTQVLVGVAEEPVSEVKPSKAWSTAMVRSSASLNWGEIPTSGRQIRSDELVASSSSIFTYSAVAKVSISVSTVTSQVESLV